MAGGGSSSSKKRNRGSSWMDSRRRGESGEEEAQDTEAQSGLSEHQQKLAALLESFGTDMNPIVNAQLNKGYGQQLQEQGLPMHGEAPPYTPPANDPEADPVPDEDDGLSDGIWGSSSESYYDRMLRDYKERMRRGQRAHVAFGNNPDRY